MSKPIVVFLLFASAGALGFLIWVFRYHYLYRKVLEEKYRHLKSLRLYKMLEYLGIDQHEYLRKVPGLVIEQQMYRCSQCPSIGDCDECLRDKRCLIDMHFCPNYSSLMAQSHYFAEKSNIVSKFLKMLYFR